jgi:hypothetical protein
MSERMGLRLTIKRLIVLAMMLAGAVVVAWHISQNGFSYKEVIVGLSLLIGGCVVFGGEHGITFGFVLWVLTLALGYRTIEWTKDLRIHPSELLLWLLLISALAQRSLLERTRLSLPWWLWLFIPFWALAWWPLIAGDAPWDKMLNEFRNFLLLIPMIIVAPVALSRPKIWKYLVGAFFLVGTWIAVMGVVEYWFPDFTKLAPAFVKNAKAEATADGFVRAQFSFWGSQTATFICALALPFGIVLAKWWRYSYRRVLVVFAAALQLLAIYIGGYRSIWALVLIQALIALTFGVKRYGLALAGLCLVVAVAGYQYVPNSHERVLSSIAAFQGAPIDHSSLDRKERALDAIDRTIASPFGNGWGSSGWVHSDFLQVAANLGIFAALIFVAGYLHTLFRLSRRILFMKSRDREDDDHLGFALFMALIAVGGLLTTQGVEVLPQLMLPVWFVWTLVEVWLRQTGEIPEFSYSYARPTLYPAANFQ